MNSLVEKRGMLTGSAAKRIDGVVYVRLLEKGENAYHHHEDYHKQMTQAIVDKLDKSEIPVLLKTLDSTDWILYDYTEKAKKNRQTAWIKNRQKMTDDERTYRRVRRTI